MHQNKVTHIKVGWEDILTIQEKVLYQYIQNMWIQMYKYLYNVIPNTIEHFLYSSERICSLFFLYTFTTGTTGALYILYNAQN